MATKKKNDDKYIKHVDITEGLPKKLKKSDGPNKTATKKKSK